MNKSHLTRWKHDYNSNAWNEFMAKTENQKEYNKTGHYRRRQDKKVKVIEGAQALDSVDAIF